LHYRLFYILLSQSITTDPKGARIWPIPEIEVPEDIPCFPLRDQEGRLWSSTVVNGFGTTRPTFNDHHNPKVDSLNPQPRDWDHDARAYMGFHLKYRQDLQSDFLNVLEDDNPHILDDQRPYSCQHLIVLRGGGNLVEKAIKVLAMDGDLAVYAQFAMDDAQNRHDPLHICYGTCKTWAEAVDLCCSEKAHAMDLCALLSMLVGWLWVLRG
jgi:hypothetical protein